MALLIINHVVGDYETFKDVFLDDQERRRRLGSKSARVYKVDGDPNNIRVVLEFETVEQARDARRGTGAARGDQVGDGNVSMPLLRGALSRHGDRRVTRACDGRLGSAPAGCSARAASPRRSTRTLSEHRVVVEPEAVRRGEVGVDDERKRLASYRTPDSSTAPARKTSITSALHADSPRNVDVVPGEVTGDDLLRPGLLPRDARRRRAWTPTRPCRRRRRPARGARVLAGHVDVEPAHSLDGADAQPAAGELADELLDERRLAAVGPADDTEDDGPARRPRSAPAGPPPPAARLSPPPRRRCGLTQSAGVFTLKNGVVSATARARRARERRDPGCCCRRRAAAACAAAAGPVEPREAVRDGPRPREGRRRRRRTRRQRPTASGSGTMIAAVADGSANFAGSRPRPASRRPGPSCRIRTAPPSRSSSACFTLPHGQARTDRKHPH